MRKLINSLKYIKSKDLIAPFIFLIILPFSFIFKIINVFKKRKLWVICESGDTARDNGYYFYKYIKEKHPEDFCFYVIDKKSSDYQKLHGDKTIIKFKSIKHWFYYMSANLNISSQKSGNPNQPFFYFIHVVLKIYPNRVFLQHGITKDDSLWLYHKNTNFKYFICGAKKEYEYIKEKFGYPEGSVIYTGFPRFDNLHDYEVNKNQILIMPTWRNWLGREKNNFSKKQDFLDTNYYKNWNGLLNSEKFINYIEQQNITVYFYPHYNMQKFMKYFEINSDNIKIVDNSCVDIQTLLKESEILITDYSSVYMDFAYMNKKIIYFQFDYEEYRKNQYLEGYYNYKTDSFGPIANNYQDIIKNLFKINNDFDSKYLKRANAFFELRDKNNCSRLYEVIRK